VEPSPNKRRLLNFLTDHYGQKIISGQMDTSWSDTSDMDMIKRVFDDTGKYPALKGFDYLNIRMLNGGGSGSKQTNEAIQWWEGRNANRTLVPDRTVHGIVAFCWHWRMPLTGTTRGNDDNFYPNTGNNYAKGTAFRIPWKDGKLNKSSAEWKLIQEDLDLVARELETLKDKDIPVLWRPLHEAGGGWFWWGASGPAPYIALWEYMYDYFTNAKGLNNLIWVWNGQKGDWYPNPATVDIVGYDVYPRNPRDYGSQSATFAQTYNMANGDRMVALTENGEIPDPDKCKTDGAMWSWFMTWNDGRPAGTHQDNFWSGEYHNTGDHKQKVYNHDLVITLDELPDLTEYRLE
jgi:mannan endo-1,4-beta-mannosidase